MKISTKKDQTVNQYPNEFEGVWAGVDQNRAGHMPAPDAADGPAPIFLLIAFAATALIIAGVALSLAA